MNTLLLTIKLLQPLLLAYPTAGEENSAVSLDYIPGSTLRGALIERFLQHNPESDLLSDALAKRLFFSNEVLYLNAYLADSKGLRSLPTPFSWAVEKGSEDDSSASIVDLAQENTASLSDPKSLKNTFCWVEVDYEDQFDVNVIAIVSKVQHQPQLHNASQKRFIKREEDSTLFRYDALAVGQRFSAAILCADATLASELCSLLSLQELCLGRSRSAGYGRVAIEQVTEPTSWVEYTLTPTSTDQWITLTLLSDAILRHPQTGDYTTDLQTALELAQNAEKAFVASDMAGGFNRTWGMPLTQSPTLQAGSVWVFKHHAELFSKLIAWEKTGIGERRNEGFGRIAVNWHTTPELNQEKLIKSSSLSSSLTLIGPDALLAQAMVNRLYRQQLEDKLLELATGALEIRGIIENAQLSRLRTIVRQAAQEQQPTFVLDFLKSRRDTARTQFRRARLGGKPFLRWLEEGWSRPKAKQEGGQTMEQKVLGLWNEYFYIAPGSRPVLGNVTAQDELPLQLEYMARLVDVICKRAIQKQQAQKARVA